MVKKAQRAGDKWYQMAKQQGYRARSAFKLIQMNRQYDFLSNAHILLDLCAAPGGWCQVAAKFMPVESKIVGVDLVPIKPIPGVKTFCEDITTQKCRQTLRNEFKNKQCDVVLHDGAGNVGGGWAKDAFDQNVLVLHALKLASEFLKRGGLFITKVFRSSDYTALMYVFNQLFSHVQATKPLSSRSESAEIFVVCQNYLAPNIDPKLLDPNYVFKQIQAEQKPLLIFDKHAGDQKRFRGGYDESLGVGLKRTISVDQYIRRDDPLRVLTDAHELAFDEDSQMYLNSKYTDEEVKECCKDLRVLNKSDFKMLLKWRLNILKEFKEELKDKMISSRNTLHDEIMKKEEEKKEEEEPKDIEEQLQELRERLALKNKREKKRLRKELNKKKKRALLGLDQMNVDIESQDIFDLNTIKTKEDFDAFHDINIEDRDSDDSENEHKEDELEEEIEDYDALLETQLDDMYESWKTRKDAHDKEAQIRLSQEKGLPARKKKERQQLAELFDEELDATKAEYSNMMKQSREAIDQTEDFNNEEVEDIDETPGYLEYKAPKKNVKEESQEVTLGKWYSNNVFDGIDLQSLAPTVAKSTKEESSVQKESEAMLQSYKRNIDDEDYALLNSDQEAGQEDSDSDMEEIDEKQERKFERNREKRKKEENIWGEMPKTDKEKRHEKRLKMMEKKNRKELKPDDLEVVQKEFYHANRPKEGEDVEYQNLIRQGMGSINTEGEEDMKLEVVKNDFDPKMGSEEHAQALAIGELLSHPSTARDFIDSCYNRYAFNDDEDLPQWFLDDERKYNKPQLPITKEAVERIRQRFREKNQTPIRKELEAQSRKQRRMQRAREKAKTKIDSINNDEDMTDAAKLRAIQKLLKGRTAKKPGKMYVVARKGKMNKHLHNGRTVKLVDKRLKADTRKEKLSRRHKKGGAKKMERMNRNRKKNNA